MRIYLLYLISLLHSALLLAQPVNDDCGGIIDLGIAPICPATSIYNNVGATTSTVFSSSTDNLPSCFNDVEPLRDVWFQFMVPADGSMTSFTVTVTGVNDINGSIVQPQIAAYRGDCLEDELQELSCAPTSPQAGIGFVSLDLMNLTPGLPIFLRINDWSSNGTPNSGDFELCVKEFVEVFNMGETAGSEACSGTLFDSGGENENYSNFENLTFTICPQDFHECIFIDVVNFDIEATYDFLRIFAGEDTNAPQIAEFSAQGNDVHLEAASECITVQFTSDFLVTNLGFELTWECSSEACAVTPTVSCTDPEMILSLPYSNSGLTTCGAGNTVSSGPCNDDLFLLGEEYIFAYESPGNECITVTIDNSNIATGLAIYDDCPNVANECLAIAGGFFGFGDPSVSDVFLETSGTYYIVVGNTFACTPFDITVEKVNCPVVFPSAALCEDALSLNGCSEQLPAIISVGPGQGDPSCIQLGVNSGCWGSTFPYNYTWFFFEAQAAGEFGFTMEAADPNEASDVDFQVWGPIDNLDLACTFIKNNQPVRSSYAPGTEPTGLINVHPVTGATVTDECEDEFGDDFVKTLSVQAGKYYFVLVNDWGEEITSGAVSIDFGVTSEGVLDGAGDAFSISPDVTVCPNEATSLVVEGGEIWHWFPADGLSCTDCPNPIATVSETTTYQVQVVGICETDTLAVQINMPTANAGADQTICLNGQIELQPNTNLTGVTFEWQGPAGTLSCTDCATPTVIGISPGTFEYTLLINGPDCTFSDVVEVTVLTDEAPTFDISEDVQVCIGDAVNLGGIETPGVSYEWTSNPTGFNSNNSNPSVVPSETTTYILEATNGFCPLEVIDSVVIEVASVPEIQLENDTIICTGSAVLLANFQPESDVTYQWSPATHLDNPNSPMPIATPTETTEYFLTATRGGCTIEASIVIEIIEVSLQINSPDTIGLCQGESLDLQAVITPFDAPVMWTPNDGSLNTVNGTEVIITPHQNTLYFATLALPNGCMQRDSVWVEVDFLPDDLSIFPLDTMVCPNESVLLESTDFNPTDFPNLTFQWLENGQLLPDEAPELLINPTESATYLRIASNGYCTDTSAMTIHIGSTTTLAIAPLDTIVCAGDLVTLTASLSAEVEGAFIWEPTGDIGKTITVNASNAATYTVTFEDNAGCQQLSATAQLNILPAPEIIDFIVFPEGDIYQGTEVTVEVIPAGEGLLFYEWSNGEADSIFTLAPLEIPGVSYTVTITNEQGCSTEGQVDLPILEPEIHFPNAFTPDNDSVNDIFQAVIFGENIEMLSFNVFNRWGQLVHEGSGIDHGWNGKQGEEPAPSEVYIFRALYRMPNGVELVYSGDVTLLR